MLHRKSLYARYLQLSLWNKVAVWGAAASMVGVGLSFLPGRPTLQQLMMNSPGGIQAGRDVVIAPTRRLIESISLHVAISADTPPTDALGQQPIAGLSSCVALFTHDGTRIRFTSGFTITDVQLSQTRRQLQFVYEPETPTQILGRNVDFLATMKSLVVNYSEIAETVGFDTNGKEAMLECVVMLNGIPIATLKCGQGLKDAITTREMSFNVSEYFALIPSTYEKALSH